MKMDKTQVLFMGFALYLLTSDLWNAFNPPPPKPRHTRHHHHHDVQPQEAISVPKDPLAFTDSTPIETGARPGVGATVQISFCTSCSYRGTALTMKKMLESAFPGIDVVLSNYPPPLPKRMISKLVPGLQIGSVVLVVAGDHIFPRLGFTAPPPWYYSLKQKRFAVVATTWLLGNALQSFLQSTGAFEVQCNGDLVFSRLRENRFPGEYELKELISRSLGTRDSFA
eukprot:Gb_36844 [translate_table: standard]